MPTFAYINTFREEPLPLARRWAVGAWGHISDLSATGAWLLPLTPAYAPVKSRGDVGMGSRRARGPKRPGNPAASPTSTQLKQQDPKVPRAPTGKRPQGAKNGDDFTRAGGQAGRQAVRSVSQPVITGRPGPRYTCLGTHVQTGSWTCMCTYTRVCEHLAQPMGLSMSTCRLS